MANKIIIFCRQKICIVVLIAAALLVISPPLMESLFAGVVARSIPVNGRNSIRIAVPDRWQYTMHHKRKERYCTMVFMDKSDNSFRFIVTVHYPRNFKYDPKFNNMIRIRYHVSLDRNNLIPASVEKRVSLKEIKGRFARGYYFSVTRRSNRKKGLVVGGAGIGHYLIRFSVKGRGKSDPHFKQAVEAIETARPMRI